MRDFLTNNRVIGLTKYMHKEGFKRVVATEWSWHIAEWKEKLRNQIPLISFFAKLCLPKEMTFKHSCLHWSISRAIHTTATVAACNVAMTTSGKTEKFCCFISSIPVSCYFRTSQHRQNRACGFDQSGLRI